MKTDQFPLDAYQMTGTHRKYLTYNQYLIDIYVPYHWTGDIEPAHSLNIPLTLQVPIIRPEPAYTWEY